MIQIAQSPSGCEVAALDEIGQARKSADLRTRYRPHVDGLRAVAVLSVIAYHLSPKLLPGGYLGVDVFFVISGFLITSVIWREAKNGDFSILRFYERRIRRIMPALLVLLAVSSAIGTCLLLPIDLVGFGHSLFASLGFSANIYFWRDTNYFTHAANERPLLHLWSLGVEEQFYILFPPLVAMLARRRASVVLVLVALLSSISFVGDVLAIHAGANIPAFYLLPTRAWEIGAGCVLALMPLKNSRDKRFGWSLELLALLFIATGLCLNSSPLWSAFVPPALWVVLGTSFTIYLGEIRASWFNRWLSTRVLVGVGLISYSLYLWHWPILVFARYCLVREQFSAAQELFLVVLMLACALLSWKYIEQPFRNRRIPIRQVCLGVAAGTICLLIVSTVLVHQDGFPARFDPSIAKIDAAVGSEFRCSLRQTFPFGGYRACLIGTPGIDVEDVSVALVGNSHAQMYAPLVSDVLKGADQAAILAHLNGCVPMTDLNISQACLEQAKKNIAAVEALPHIRLVILATTWKLNEPMVTSSGAVVSTDIPNLFTASLDRLIDRFQHDGKSVVLIGPIAYPNYDLASIVGRQLAYSHSIKEPLYRPRVDFLAEYGKILSHFASRNDIAFIRPDEIQCLGGRCDFFRDGVPLFADSDHLSQVSLNVFRPAIEPALSRSVKRSLR